MVFWSAWCFRAVLISAHLVALAVASLRLCSCRMVHTRVENEYVGPTNKTNTGVRIPNQIIANLSFILYSDLSQQMDVAMNKPDEELGPWHSSHQPEWRLKRPLGLSGCFRPSRWIIEWAHEQKVSSHVCLSVTGVHLWMRPFLVEFTFKDTKWGWFKLAHGWQRKRYRLLVIRPYLFSGARFGPVQGG